MYAGTGTYSVVHGPLTRGSTLVAGSVSGTLAHIMCGVNTFLVR